MRGLWQLLLACLVGWRRSYGAVIPRLGAAALRAVIKQVDLVFYGSEFIFAQAQQRRSALVACEQVIKRYLPRFEFLHKGFKLCERGFVGGGECFGCGAFGFGHKKWLCGNGVRQKVLWRLYGVRLARVWAVFCTPDKGIQ